MEVVIVVDIADLWSSSTTEFPVSLADTRVALKSATMQEKLDRYDCIYPA
jgi:hypothetical protein